MESYFGSRLIVRRNTGVSLTEAGQVFLNWSEAITREMKNMVNENECSDQQRGGGCLLWFPFAGRVYLYVGDGASV